MSIVRGVYEGFTAIIYGFILDIALKALLLMGFTDLTYDVLQLIIAILWIGIGMFGWGNICIVNRGSCRLSTIYRYIMFIAPPLMTISYLLYLYGDGAAAAVLFLIAVSVVLGLSVSSYVGAYMVSNQFRSNVGRVGAIISIVAIIMWLALIPNIMEVGTALNALGNALILIVLLQVRRRYSPTARARRR
ncbi:hypothetical protein [Vulcanisaeta distributa]|uniref:Uncharacterized protein n=1 Tax=Vulcanisaeta distributa (strain DSM 14429 / JCM 11212 / NBRC 100878 / IC-017) TaxID=572478 RepID=E1QPW3_VULDI|nr:hypothetical protein [Vulcanisaeta distributa]ADN51523.1 hypothetical protein Vdis_2154 [Vulcanisaeta distributa DSM 14429]